jgi:hypothetical protein
VLYYRLREPRAIVIKLQMVGLLIETKPLQPVGVRELAQKTELFNLEGILKLVPYGHGGHGPNYSIWQEPGCPHGEGE